MVLREKRSFLSSVREIFFNRPFAEWTTVWQFVKAIAIGELRPISTRIKIMSIFVVGKKQIFGSQRNLLQKYSSPLKQVFNTLTQPLKLVLTTFIIKN
jgi:hypothetical protein